MPQYRDPDFCHLPASLAAVFEASDQTSFFGLPQWYDLMARYAVPGGTEISVITDERPSSMAALVLQKAAGKGSRSLSSLANFYSVEHGIIAAPGADLGQAFTAIISEVLAERPRLERLCFSELDPLDSGYRELHRVLRNAGFLVERSFSAGTWYESTAGLRFADYLTRRPSELRNTWQRKQRSLERSCRLESAFFPENIGIEKAIADYQTVYSTSWKVAEPFPLFMPALIRLAAELGALRLGVYYIDGAPAAAQFWILWRGRAVIYKLAHNRHFDKLSLGTLLTMEMMERVLQNDRPDEINFGRGDDPYKKLWLSQRRERWNISAFNPRTISGLRSGLIRQTAKAYHWLRQSHDE